MFNELLEKDNTKEFIDKLYSYEIYKNRDYSNYDLIGVFYDALFKYSIIIENIEYFDKFLEELDLLFRRVEELFKIKDGVNKILSGVLINKLEIKDKEEFIRYVYDRYIDNGYFIHAYSPVYTENIKNNGFIINNYTNLYKDFSNLKNILNKYKDNYISKDFDLNEVVFTDSMELAYFYSLRSPMYFYELICGDEFILNKDVYIKKNYKECLNNINKVIKKLNVSSEDSNYIIDLFNREWKLLNNDNLNNSSLILVKRNIISDEKFDVEKFINDFKEEDYDIIFDRLVNNNYSNVICNKNIEVKDIMFLVIKNKKEIFNEEIEEISNDNGLVSIFIIVGAIVITFGVIVTLIMLL